MFAGYRIERVLDRGGMGVVYKAVDEDLDREVALKIIAPEHTQDDTAVARFKSECRLAASLEHANIVPIHRGGEFEGILYLAMRFVPGTNLRAIIDRGPMELDQVASIVTQVAGALDAAHAKGLVHRDVKPANILIAGEPRQAARLPHRLRPDEAPGLRRRGAHPRGRLGRHARLRRARADPGPHRRPPRRRVLAGLRPLRDADRPRRLREGQRHGQALGPCHRPAAAAADGPPASSSAPSTTSSPAATAKDPGHRYATAGDLADGDARRDRPAGARERSRSAAAAPIAAADSELDATRAEGIDRRGGMTQPRRLRPRPRPPADPAAAAARRRRGRGAGEPPPQPAPRPAPPARRRAPPRPPRPPREPRRPAATAATTLTAPAAATGCAGAPSRWPGCSCCCSASSSRSSCSADRATRRSRRWSASSVDAQARRGPDQPRRAATAPRSCASTAAA